MPSLQLKPPLPVPSSRLGRVSDSVASHFHKLALVVEFAQAYFRGELHLTKLTTVLHAFSHPPHDAMTFAFVVLIAFIIGALWPRCVSKLHRVFASTGTNTIALTMNVIFACIAVSILVIRPTDMSVWIIACGFIMRIVKEVRRSFVKRAGVGTSGCHTKGIQTLGTIDIVEPEDVWLGPYGE